MREDIVQEIIDRLSELDKMWEDDVMLFADCGTLLLIDRRTKEVLEVFPSISCDGGDPGSRNENGRVYLDL